MAEDGHERLMGAGGCARPETQGVRVQLRAETRDGSTMEHDSCAASPCRFVGAAARVRKICALASAHKD